MFYTYASDVVCSHLHCGQRLRRSDLPRLLRWALEPQVHWCTYDTAHSTTHSTHGRRHPGKGPLGNENSKEERLRRNLPRVPHSHSRRPPPPTAAGHGTPFTARD
eukprot:scaffold19455_cov129-Isochrysis_galbana.AAC.2